MESKVERYVENYVVNKNTMALLPVILSEKKIVTRVVEMNDSFFVFQKPLDIIERSCRKHGSSFLGRKEGTKELTHITHKAPIAISPTDQLYFFPTYSYSRKECAWLSHFYIESNKEIKKIEGTITDIDKDHFDRLEYFFKKHGFDVQFRLDDNGERIGGRIYKIIN